MNVTIYLTSQEEEALKELCKKQELSPGNLLKQALRLYQAVTLGNMHVEPIHTLRKHLEPSEN